jgi:hypothetical protein
MIKISHEVPLCLLQDSKEFNDYHYCLPHLLDKFSEYKRFFLKCREDGDFIIMDNGLFEGVTHTNKDLLEKINLINPNIFIVPDVWNNADLTLRNARQWMNNYKDSLPHLTNFMVVLQGETYYNIKLLYQHCVDLGFTHFAFNHSSITYQNMFPNKNKLVSQMLGRINLISRLYEEKMIWDSHYIHLLGCSLPQEFMYYDDYKFIQSVDTSNPIIKGAKDETYDPFNSLTKPSEKIEEFMEMDLNKRKNMIIYNVKIFRRYIYDRINKSVGINV